jgi:hypothetical protein
MSGVLDGQPVDASITNAAFITKNGNDQDPSQLDFISSSPASGPSVIDIQKNVNSIASFLGALTNQIYNYLPTWATNNRGTSTDNVKARAAALDLAFDATSGHKHTGAFGDGPLIASSSIAGSPLYGYIIQGTDIIGVSSSSSDVSSQFSSSTPSTGSNVAGVVVNNPQNKVIIRNSATDNLYSDGSGNTVYGRITNSGSTWTLSYYTEVTGVETAYTFGTSSGIRFYYQLLSPILYAFNSPYDILSYIIANLGSGSGGSGGGTAYAETPTGVINASNTSFTLSHTPGSQAGTFLFFDGGIYPDNLWSLTGSTITFNTAPPLGTILYCIYNATMGGGGSSLIEAHGKINTPVAIDPTVGIPASTANDQVWWITPSTITVGSIPITASPQISAGVTVGQRLTVFGVTSGSGGYLKIANGSGVYSNGDYNMLTGQGIVYMWNGSQWQFVSNAI